MLLERLSFRTRRTPRELLDFAASSGLRYKVYPIPKRSGGVRMIEQPSKSVKAIQRWLEKALFKFYPVHAAAKGYRTGISIRDNALVHAETAYTVRLDFENFFWSFTRESIVGFFSENRNCGVNLTDDDITFIADVTTRNGRAVMGAPSSPSLTNLMMYPLDAELEKIARSYDANYTRYADDIFFSSNSAGSSYAIERDVVKCVAASAMPVLKIKNEKTAFLSRRSKRTVTGLVITSDGRVSLGRDRKRMIKALLHKAINSTIEDGRLAELAGYINWARSSDPEFYESLRVKYGDLSVSSYSKPNIGD